MSRLTPQQRLDREMQKAKDMGITVSFTRNAAGIPNPVMDELEAAADRAGIVYQNPEDER